MSISSAIVKNSCFIKLEDIQCGRDFVDFFMRIYVAIFALITIASSSVLLALEDDKQSLDLRLDAFETESKKELDKLYGNKKEISKKTKKKKGIDETLNAKLKKYEGPRLEKNYEDQYGMSIERQFNQFGKVGKGENPALNEQLDKSDGFKRIYEGPQDNSKNNQFGLKLSMPLGDK